MKNMWNSFDEETYLRLNPDVAAKVKQGAMISGWQHFLLHGFSENRQGGVDVDAAARPFFLANSPSTPMPRDNLRKRVHGGGSETGFRFIGKAIAFDLEMAIASANVNLMANSRILDFGCGCARVLPWVKIIHQNISAHGTDIDAEAISWCKDSLSSVADFLCNNITPPLPFSDAYFDFIFSISVFTHLPETMQLDWLAELRRVTRMGGILALSVHGSEILGKMDDSAALPPDAKKYFQGTGFYYLPGRGTEGLPEFYQMAFHSEDYIEDYIKETWGKLFKIMEIRKRGINNHQDLVICQA